jgi:hypothetical protein
MSKSDTKIDANQDDSPERASLTRRNFLAGTIVAPLLACGVATVAAAPEARQSAAPVTPSTVTGDKFIAIQAGAVSFVDEGVDKVLDIVQQSAGVNAMMLATFSYGNGIAGRAVPGQPLPDHGAQHYDADRKGGDFAEVHSQYYRDTVFRDFRAPDVGNFDVLAEVVPKAKARGMKTFCWYEDQINPDLVAGFEQNAAEIDVYGRPTRFPCFNNPHVRDFFASLSEDWVKSYAVDGVMFTSEREGPLHNTIVADGVGPGRNFSPTCFCRYCLEKARTWGVDPERARAAYFALDEWVRAVRANGRPADGNFVTFWRLLIEYPELLSWEKLWTDNLWSFYRLLYGELKAIRPELAVGWHIWHNNSFSPFFRAEVDYAKFAECSDYLKIVAYNNCAGPRMAQYVRNIHSTVFGDVTAEETLQYHYEMLGYKGEADLDHLAQSGFTAQYVAEEARRALAGAAGRYPIYMGIDIDVPTGPGDKKTQPEDVRLAVRAALEAGAQGVVLSRKYSEMKLANLSAAGQALKEIGIWKG